jgi:hypothetical protein
MNYPYGFEEEVIMNPLNAWHFSDARRTPGGPEIGKHHFPFCIGHFEILTIERFNSPIIISQDG